MSDLRLDWPVSPAISADGPPVPIGRHLVRKGLIAPQYLVHALELQRHIDAPLGEIMVSEGLVSRDDVLDALSDQANAQRVDLTESPPAAEMCDALPAAICIAHNVVPWMYVGRTLLVATNDPGKFDHLRACLGARAAYLVPVISDSVQIAHHQSRLYGAELAAKASVRVPAIESCRNWGARTGTRRWIAFCALGLSAAALIVSPIWTITIAMIYASLTLLLTAGMKAAAFWAQITHGLHDRPAAFTLDKMPFRLPRVSVLVPLLHEKEIASALIKRLSQLTYPKSLLDVILVLEASDDVTRETIARTDLPNWMSVIEVPDEGGLLTKPRALNYALDFCRGTVIGVWDAEDWPEPDQIERVVTRFHDAPDNVACLQGILDYYNSRTNWMSRCFTIEYATWWRVVLPGMAKLGLVIPLGGTTLFFRRDILERLGGWDAHNVTEDADLGVRLARHGYVTELLPTVTFEEANCRPWPWVRQRSRWLKGFMITYLVHMRSPRKLLRELGFVRFMGLQSIFLATFSQFACAPLLWSFWLALAGVTHPVSHSLGATAAWAMAALFLITELLNLGMSLVAVSGRGRRHLLIWVVTMPLYFTLGAVASYKALYEMIAQPFFWDKTQHGVAAQTDHPSS
ncbi:glycosyltransferase family 2 protein [Sulfitobacter sabulilitoris]|uniref:Glycosyltransferase n=1 Tax=Sulfitobacter sabulilitoris TaxID=2562655 RepID=A0A5S3PGL3_9RHOB|nr:glycosyltransferase [Sulfitobacter sabulilitoris]TMM50782.1 glycosyltransferase [Sulfitobacter sabulilitoris]